ncbi:MAG: hypothetical protein ACJ74H_20385 [Thermoanaerobaculia bacterium]
MRELWPLDLPGDVLEDGVVARAVPVIDTVIRRRCRYWRVTNDLAEDIRGEALVRLMKRLRDPESGPIGGIEEYVAGVTSRVIDDVIRAASPEWARLKNRVRYVLNHDDRFRVSAMPDGSIVCALQPATVVARSRPHTHAAVALANTIVDVLRAEEQGWTINDVVNAVAAKTGVADPVYISGERIATVHAPDPGRAVESIEYLRQLWREILELPRRQRLALLLNARDAAGESVLRLLVSEGIAAPRDVAAALEVGEAELEALSNGLPLLDAAIAERLQVTRQQVINLRKAARDRLARRMMRTR